MKLKLLNEYSFVLLSAAAVASSHTMAQQEPDPLIAVEKMRQFCSDCHAVGKLRFLRSANDQELWNNLFIEKSPVSQKIWAELIVKVLSWPPGRSYPDFNTVMTAPDKDWMPKGFSRVELSDDKVGDVPAREIIIREINKKLEQQKK